LTTQKRERDNTKPAQAEAIEALLGAAVLRALGTPNDLRSVQVRRLWDVSYRVNVVTGADAISTAITHSYFLTTDGAGGILDATPAIVKQY
jgi:hypothetical protein